MDTKDYLYAKDVETTFSVVLRGGAGRPTVKVISRHSKAHCELLNPRVYVSDGKETCWEEYSKGMRFFKTVAGEYYPVADIQLVIPGVVKETLIKIPRHQSGRSYLRKASHDR